MLGRAGGTAAVVLAAGEGTRMRSALPKVLHPLAGRALVEHAVRAAAGVTPDDLVVVVGHGRDAVQPRLDTLADAVGRSIRVAVQAQQRGTGHAVGCALDQLMGHDGATPNGTVLVSYGDVPLMDTATLGELLAVHRDAGNAVTVLTAELADPTGYGRILRDRAGTVTGIVEHRDADAGQRAIQEINSGVYAFDAAVLHTALAKLGAATGDAVGELYLTDVLGMAHADGCAVGALRCPDPWLVAGVNDRVQLAELGAEYNRRLLRRWMLDGVTVLDPASVWVDADVTLAPDVLLKPGVALENGTSVAEGARIGPDTTLSGCTVGADATVIRTHAVDARIGPGANVGPFAYLRPGSEIGERAKVGTFVETKNAQLGAGAKVPHLSYVGDATIGEGSNIGAATVFVNYDGVAKHRTSIGAHARTGSDNMFIAPVTVGDGAYTGAGTVVREDVPPGSLAVSSPPQRNIDGWVLRKRPGTPAAEAALAASSSDDAASPDAPSDASPDASPDASVDASLDQAAADVADDPRSQTAPEQEHS